MNRLQGHFGVHDVGQIHELKAISLVKQGSQKTAKGIVQRVLCVVDEQEQMAKGF